MSFYRDYNILPGEDLSFVGAHMFKDIHGFMRSTGQRCVVLGLVHTAEGLAIAHMRAPDTLRIVYETAGEFAALTLDGRIADAVRVTPERPTPETSTFVRVSRWRLDPGSIARKIKNLVARKPEITEAAARQHFVTARRNLDAQIAEHKTGRYYLTYFHTAGKKLLMEFLVLPCDSKVFEVKRGEDAGAQSQTMGEGVVPLFLN